MERALIRFSRTPEEANERIESYLGTKDIVNKINFLREEFEELGDISLGENDENEKKYHLLLNAIINF